MTFATDKQKALMEKLNLPIANGLTLEEAKKMLDEHFNKIGNNKPLNAKPSFNKPKLADNGSYYVAYCKDLVVSMLGNPNYANVDLQMLMSSAIKAIDSAKKAFN
jgi:hypothetical protein